MLHKPFGRLIGLVMCVAILWSSVPAPSVEAQEHLCFPENGECISGRMLTYWSENGGLAVFGFPIAPPREEQNRDTGQIYLTQWFERNRLELHPENAAPYDVLLGRLGDDRLIQAGRSWQLEGRETGPQAGCLWFEQTGHNVCNQGGNQGFRRYWETHGLRDPRLSPYQRSLALFGLPLTSPRMETNSSGDTVLTQWFERARFEWHPNNADEFQVLLGRLGSEVRADRTHSSAPAYLAHLNGMVYFAARDGKTGNELWRSNGTAEGTEQVKDIVPGPDSGSAFQLTPVNGSLLFTAFTPDTGNELWRSDGSEQGTFMLRDIHPGSLGSFPSQYRRIGNTLFFIADDGTHSAELWKSDGTPEGTVLVKDIRPGAESSVPEMTERNTCCRWELTDVNGTLFFAANDGVNGTEIWRSDGTADGTQRVTDAGPEYVAPTNLVNVNGVLFFTWIRTNGPIQLWRTDGTTSGTRLVKDWSGAVAPSARVDYPTNVNGTLFFTLPTVAHGNELWKSDGTSQGTAMVTDIQPGTGSSSPLALTPLGNMVIFGAWYAGGQGMWRSDGTAASTVFLARVQPISSEPWPLRLTEINGNLIFFGSSANERRELWLTNGTPSGTRMVTILPGSGPDSPRWPIVANNRIFFAHNDDMHGQELWSSDLTAAGTSLVRDINTER